VRVCLISVEIFAWGKFGGFGRATRTIGRELVSRGVEAVAVVPRRNGQRPEEDLDGIRVLGFPPAAPWQAADLLRAADADIYHSCEPSLATWLALRSMPDRKHMVTVRDPRDFRDWRMEFARPSLNRLQVVHNFLYENNPLVRRAIRRMDGLFTTAHFLVPKVQRMYRPLVQPGFLPTPVSVPAAVEKAHRPTVCFLARWDRRKRPTLFFELAERFPEVDFIAVGKSRDPRWDQDLRDRFGHLPNLEMTGFLDQFASDRVSEILGKSWIMVNTATREGLPNSFLEAAAHRCAILSAVDPDGFATRFGYHADRDDFDHGLRYLLEAHRWRALGEAGFRHVKETFATEGAMDAHLAIYRALLTPPRSGSPPGSLPHPFGPH
jgi:glycosyltransferase involved in cell wall biosynthesis